MLHAAFYEPKRSYEENFKEGPFGAFADSKIFKNSGEPKYDFLNLKVFAPFGIPAGPLVNGKFVKAALNKGFDITVYKTVRTRSYPVNPMPNVAAVALEDDLTPELARKGILTKENFNPPLSITNSFGVPSFDPDFWQKDMAESVAYAKQGQVVIGSFQGTVGGSAEEYIKDFALAAKLVKETGAKILEVNLSCPNEGTGHLLCFDIQRSQLVVNAIKEEIGNTPLIVKLAYFEDKDQLKKLISLMGNMAQGVAAINTIWTAVNLGDRTHSGVGGQAIKWAGLEMTGVLKTLRENMGLKYSIIGIGGVFSPEDYQNYQKAGADAVMSATGSMWNPYLAQEIKSQIR